MRLRRLATSKASVPACSPSTSITKRPWSSGSSSERRTSSRSSSRPRGETAAMNGSTSSCSARSTRKSTSAAAARRRRNPSPSSIGAHAGGAAGSASDSASALRPRRSRRAPAPDPSATPARMRTSPSAAFSVTVLVQDENAVDERDRREQVGDERRPRRAVALEQAVEEEQRDRGPEDAERDDGADGLQARDCVGPLHDREREQDERAGRARDGRDHERRACRRSCAGRSGSRTHTRTRRRRSRASPRRPTSRPRGGGRRARRRRRGRRGSPHRRSAAHALARVEPEREQDDEDRHGRVGDRRDAGVDVLLAPRDQDERERRVQEPDARTPSSPCRAPRPTASRTPERADEHGRRAPRVARTRRKNIIAVGSTSSTATLMKRYDAPPDRGDDREQRNVAADHALRLPTGVGSALGLRPGR